MKFLKNAYALLIMLLLIGWGCKPKSTDSKESESFEIVILHLNDMHAQMDNIPKLAKVIERERQENENVVLVNAGDIFSGNPFVDFAEEKGKPYIMLLNELGIAAHTVGNHEFDYSQATLNKRMEESNYPFIMANYTNTGGDLKDLGPFYIHTFNDLDFSIAFVGLIQIGSNGIPATQPVNVEGLTFSNGIIKMEEYLYLKNEHDVLIALSHLGADSDREMAAKYTEIDAIIGGHSHTIIDPAETVNGVLVAQTGSRVKSLGKITLRIENGQVVEKKGQLLPLDELTEEDEKLRAMVDEFQQNEALSKEIATTSYAIEGKNELGCMMADALKSAAQADIAFQNNGGIRMPRLNAGRIAIKDVYRLDPFDNAVVVMDLTPTEISNLIKSNSAPNARIDLQVSGMTYEIVADKDEQFVSLNMRLDGNKPLDPNRKYKVAVSSYVASAYQFDREDEGRSLNMTTADAIIQFLSDASNLDYRNCERVKVIQK